MKTTFSTIASLLLSGWLASAGILDAPAPSLTQITNIASSLSAATFVTANFPVPTTDVYGSSPTLVSPTWGTFYQVAITTPFTATNVTLSLSSVNSNTPCTIRIYQSNVPANQTNYYTFTPTLLYSNSISVAVVAQSQSFPVNATFSVGDIAFVSVTCVLSNQLKISEFYQQTANTNAGSIRLNFAYYNGPTTTTYSDGMVNYALGYTFAGTCPRFGYTQKVTAGDAATTTFTPVTTPAYATTAQAGMERLYYPLNPNKCVVVNQGDSKAHILSYLLFTNDFFTRTITNIDIAVGGTSLAWAKAAWESNAASYYGMLTNGMTGIATIWTCHNNIASVDIPGDINTYSNWLVEITASNFLPVVATCQMIRYTNQPDTNTMAYFVAINNWLRLSPLVWRCVDAEAIANNNYDTNNFQTDNVHQTQNFASLLGREFARQIQLPNKEIPPQKWSGIYGTNFYIAVPDYNTTVPRAFLTYP